MRRSKDSTYMLRRMLLLVRYAINVKEFCWAVGDARTKYMECVHTSMATHSSWTRKKLPRR